MIHKLFAKLTVLLLLACSVCEMVGVAMVGWLTRPSHSLGLWKYCYYMYMTKGDWQCHMLEDRPDFEDSVSWLQAVRVFMICSCVAPVLALIVLMFYICKNDGYANLRRIKAVIGLCILTAIFCLIGICIYSAKHYQGYGKNYNLAWAFYVTTVAGLLPVLFPVILTYEILRSRRMGTYESI